MRQPNIVFVFADQLRAQTTGFGGSGQARTPAMDRMAAEGVVFETTISNIPVCTPWRAAFLTGQYPLTKSQTPFALVLSWGPPHNPYRMVPERYLTMYPPERMEIRPNCPNPDREDLSGYDAHVTALDDQLGRLWETLARQGLMDNTVFVFTSDHGDMLGSQGMQRKQLPWDESILVPFLMRCPDQAYAGQRISSPFNVVDIMPTLLGLASAPIPDTVEGRDHTPAICGEPFEGNEAAYIMSIAPFAEYRGQPWRGVRTEQHTFVRNLDGPWLLYDNRTDPFPMNNLTGISEYAGLQQSMDDLLRRMMKERGDELLPAQAFLDRYGYEVDEEWGAVPYNP